MRDERLNVRNLWFFKILATRGRDMNFKIMPKSAFSDWVDRLIGSYRVVGPKRKHGQYVFDELGSVEGAGVTLSN